MIGQVAADHGFADVCLPGYSHGTISSKWLAVALDNEGKGSIHTAAMTVQGGGSFALCSFSAGRVPLQEVRAHVLHIHHREDAWHSAPYATVPALAGEDLVTAPRGTPTGDPCGRGHHCSYPGV